MSFALSVPELAAVRAVLLREFRAAFINRYLQVFIVLALLGGIASAVFAEDGNAIGFFLMQIAIYLVSLLALLAGVSSAQGERTEWEIMFAQPVRRGIFVLAKFAAYLSIFAAVLMLMLITTAIASARFSSIAILCGQTLLLAGVFLALGLTIGFLAHDRAHALIAGVGAWLLLLFGFDLVALFAARWSTVQSLPDLWVALLMMNPLDAFRIHALFALEQIPAEAANKTALASWWITHAGTWFAAVAVAWSAVLSTVAALRLNRWEE